MMARAKGGEPCAPGKGAGRCRVDSMVSVDSRGQMVLRKELRERAGIRSGDQLAVVTWETENVVCCISLIRVDELGQMAKEYLGPMMKTMITKKE